MGFVRIMLIILTLLLWVAGSVFVGLAGYSMVEDMKFKGLTGSLALDISILGTASFIFLIGFFGCLGATLRKRNILKLFFALLIFFLMIQIALVVVYFAKRSELEGLIKISWKDMTDEGRESIQSEMNCCGMEVNEPYASYNVSLCITKYPATKPKTCFGALVDWIHQRTITVVSSGCAFIFIEIMMLIFTCMHIREIGRGSTVVPLNMSQRTGPPRQRMQRGPQGFGQPPQPNYSNANDNFYLEDYEEDPVITHTRREWVKHNSRNSWKLPERKNPR
ncbi:leukocyte surface antigen CD53-like [Rhopilema esculentum]|uniref:leukocyte surface antigen CD53-like n=1 Tax=Rhopilema esculentum TaxID=499914 RepID=UPI0031D21FF7